MSAPDSTNATYSQPAINPAINSPGPTWPDPFGPTRPDPFDMVKRLEAIERDMSDMREQFEAMRADVAPVLKQASSIWQLMKDKMGLH